MSSASVTGHVIRAGEAGPKWCGLDRSRIFLILSLFNTIFIILKSRTRKIYRMPFVRGRLSAAFVCVGAHSGSLHLVFGGHEVILIDS